MSNRLESFVILLLRIMTYSVLAVVLWIIMDLIIGGISVINWQFLSYAPEDSGSSGGIFPAIVGTVYLILGTAFFAFPVGVGTAIFLTEYAREGLLTLWIRRSILTLAGIPSIVYGLFGLGFFVIFLKMGTSVLAGSLTLGCMILPVIIVATEEALRAVPNSLREGSIALGVSKWDTIWHNVLPYALPGILTGGILGISRAAGETAPILLTAVAFYLPELPQTVFDPIMALPYHLFILATQHPDGSAIRPMQYGTALVLLTLVTSMNLIAIYIRYSLRRRIQW